MDSTAFVLLLSFPVRLLKVLFLPLSAVELTMGEWAQKQGVVPQVFFDQSHVRSYEGRTRGVEEESPERTCSGGRKGAAKLTFQRQGVRTQDNVKRFQTVPVLGSSLSEAELAVEVRATAVCL